MDNPAENPYVGARTFSEEEAPRYFGREREARDLLALVTFEQVVLFYAQSGTGKSSLVNTKLIPGLEKGGRFEALTPSRVTGDIPPKAVIENVYVYSLMQNLAGHTIQPELIGGMRIKDFLPRLIRDTASDKRSFILGGAGVENQKTKRRVLIVDQFEELFTTHPEEWESRAGFFEQLAEALEADPNLWVVLVMREDYIAYLDPYAHLMPGGLRVRYYMQKMEAEDALKAVKSPAENAGRPFNGGVAEQLVDDLRGRQLRKKGGKKQIILGQYIEPIVLQAVCSTLWENLDQKDAAITISDLRKLGNVNKALGKYYEKRVREVAILDEVKKMGIRESEIRNWIGTQLITPDGRRNIVVRNEGGKSGGLEDSVVQLLARKKDLVREEGHGAASIYELTHDRLAEPILENNREWEKEYGFPFHPQVILWSEARGRGKDVLLLSEQALAEAEKWILQNPDQLSNLESEFVDTCRSKKQEEENQRARELKQQERELEIQKQRLEDAQKLAAEQTRSAKQARRLTATVFFFLTLAVIALFVAGSLYNTAEDNNNKLIESQKLLEVEKNNQKSLADDFTATKLSGKVFEENVEFDQSLLLGLQAYKLSNNNAQAQAALVQNFQKLQRLQLIFSPSENPVLPGDASLPGDALSPESSVLLENFNGNLRISPDGRFIAVWGKTELTIWNQITGLSEAFPITEISNIYFTPDSRLLVTVNRAGIRRWSLNENAIRTLLPEGAINFHPGSIARLFAGDGVTYFVSQGEDESVFRRDARTNESVKIEIQNQESVKFSPNGESLVGMDENGNITLQSIKDSGKVLGTFQGGFPTFSPNGSRLAVVNIDQSISIREVADGAGLINILPQLGTNISALVFSNTGSYLAVSDGAQTEIWDTRNQLKIGNPINGSPISFSPDESLFVANGVEEKVSVYCLPSINNTEAPLAGSFIGFSHDGNVVVTESFGGFFYHRVSEQCEVTSGESAAFQAESISINPMTGVLASLELDGSVLLRNLTDGTPLGGDPLYQPPAADSKDTENSENIASLQFSPGGSALAYLANNELHIWDMDQNWAEILFVDEEEFLSDPITSFALTDSLVLIGRKSGAITKWELSSGNRSDLAGNANSKIDRVVFNPESTFEALSISDNSIFLVDLNSGVNKTDEITGAFLDVNWESRLLAVLNEDGIEIWDLNMGIMINEEEPIEGVVVHFTPNGEYFLASDGFNFSLYNAATFEPVGEDLVEDNPELTSLISNPSGYELMWSPGGKIFALASRGTLVHLYEVNTETESPQIKFLGYSRYSFAGLMAFSQDGNYFFFNEGGCWIDVLNLRDAPTRWSTDRCTSGSIPMYLDDNKFIVGVNSEDDPDLASVLIYDMKNYTPGTTPEQLISSNIDLDGQVNMQGYALSDGGSELVTLGGDGKIYLWNLEKEPEVIGGVFGDARNPVGSAAISPDGTKQATFIEKGIVISDPDDNSLPERTFNNHALGITDVVFNRDGSMFAALGDRDQTIFYNSIEASEVDLIDGVFNTLDDNGYFWKTIFAGETSTIWNSSTGKKVADLSKNDEPIPSPDGNYLAIKNVQNNITLLDAGKDANENKISSDPLVGENITFNSFEGTVYLAVEPVDDGAGFDSNPLWKISSDGTALEPVNIPGSFLGFAPTGRYVATQETSGQFKIWDLATEGIADEITGSFVTFNPNGDLVVYRDQNQVILKNIAGDDIVGRATGESAKFSADGLLLVIYDDSTGRSTILSTNTGRQIDRINSAINMIEDGSENVPYVYYNVNGNSYSLLSMTEGRIDSAPIYADLVVASANGKYLLSHWFNNETGQPSTNLWDRFTGEVLGESVDLSGWEGFSEDGNLLIIRDPDGSISLLDAADPTIKVSGIAADRVLLMDEKNYAVAINDDEIVLWDINGYKEIGGIVTSMDVGSIKNVVLSPDTNRQTLVLFGSQGIVLWDVGRNEQIGNGLKKEVGTVTKMSFSPDNHYLASLGGDGIMVWEISRYPYIVEKVFISGTMIDISFSEAEDRIIYLSDDYEIFDVNIDTGTGMHTPLASPILNPARVCRYDLSDDGTRAAFLISNRVIVWDRTEAGTGIPEPIDQTVNSDCDNSAIAFSPDGSTLAILDGSQVHLWDSENNELHGRIKLTEGITFPVQPSVPIAFIDGQTIAVESLDINGTSTISLWDLGSKSEKFTIEGDLKGLSSNGSILLYRDKEERVILQDQSSEDLTRFNSMSEIMCGVVGRNFTRAEWAEFLNDQPPYPDSSEAAACPQWEIEPEPVPVN